ncbi:MAG: DUF4320 family protein [Clostridia bacterium]|nr:DUF4320 family protein [Clostridia bacterium]
MLKKIMKSKNGEGYVDMCVGVIVFVMILVIAINIFSFITLRIEMDQIADELLEAATYNGCFNDEFWARDTDMLDEYYYYDIDYGADEYFNSTYHRVQLGHVMWVKISVETEIKGLGIFKIPVTLTVHRSGLSQKYWK